jgi:hypothetical protein
MGGDQESARLLTDMQERLLPLTTFGRELQAQSQEVEAAVKDLQAIGRDLTREKLLDLVISARSGTYLQALVGLARPVMDYSFFQLLSERIDKTTGDERNRLVDLREKILELTRQVDQQVEARTHAARQLLNNLIQAEDPSEATLQNLQGIDEFFLQELNDKLEAARKQGDLEKLGKLQKVVDVLQQVSSTPPEFTLIEELLEAPDDDSRRQMLESHSEEITPDFLNALANLSAQMQNSDDKEFAERVNALNRQAMRFSMARNLK